MSLTINIYYTGEKDNAKKFANEMITSGIVDRIRKEEGNLKYEYFYPIDDQETVLLIDKWKDEEALDIHHKLDMTKEIIELNQQLKKELIKE